VFELVFFLCRVERNILKINEKSSTDFEKKDGKNNFYNYKLKKLKN